MDISELQKWFARRPKWQQDCAQRLIQNGQLSQQDIVELVSMCKSEAIGQKVGYNSSILDSLARHEPENAFQLAAISNITGINALSSRNPLNFENNPLCIVYGRNGSGKSGYVRLLKHACGSRNPGKLLPNVFVKDKVPQTAQFQLIKNGQTSIKQWTGTSIPELKGVEIYDTSCGLVYINEENEVAYEPWLLRLFTLLISACTNVASVIRAEIETLTSNKPQMPPGYTNTSAATWYANINVNTTIEEVGNKTIWSDTDERKLQNLYQRLSEANPEEKAHDVRTRAQYIKNLVRDMKDLLKNFSDLRCDQYLRAKKDALEKRNAADDASQKVFSNAPLAGIGSKTWRSLWEAARKYSEEHAYPAIAFPNIEIGSKCVLCQQELDAASRDRLNSFEKFIKSELEEQAKKAEKKLDDLTASFLDVSPDDEIRMRLNAAQISNLEMIATVLDFFDEIRNRKESIQHANQLCDILPLPEKAPLIDLLRSARKLLKNAREYDIDARNQNRQQLLQETNELNAQKWLSQQRIAVQSEISRLKKIKQLKDAIKLTDTAALSHRKSILAEELITSMYIQRFQKELDGLNAKSISVALKKTRTEIGKVYHKIILKDADDNIRTSEILSEGELRIVSLAAFLADTEGRDSKTPFIFDDPISSLDHVYEEVTAKRLVNLSTTRQVIVFTHRLSLIGYLSKYAEKIGTKPKIVCLSQYHPGQVTDLPINLKRTDKAINVLLNERLAEIKKAFTESDDTFEIIARSMCSDIRILLERVVEMDLLNDVVRRFSQEVNTKGRIGALSKISEEDCNFIDDFMTKYSRYEHSQSEEAPIPLPPPDEIEQDLKAIKLFIEEIRSRNK